MNDKTLNKVMEQELEEDEEDLVAEEMKGEAHLEESKWHQRSSKRSRVELESSTEDPEYMETIGSADKMVFETENIVDKIRRFCSKDPSRKISRDVGNQIMGMVGRLRAIILKSATRNTHLKGVLDDRTKEREREKICKFCA